MGKADLATSKVRLLEPLTSFRFIAALMVFQQHSGLLGSYFNGYGLGTVGVSFFFVLSGFILTYVYTSRLGSGSWSKAKSFYAARIAKIYPVHLLTFLMAFMLGIGIISWQYSTHILTKTIAITLANLTLIQSFFPSQSVHFAYNGVAWSISDEMFFYALFPWIIYMVVRHQKTLTLKRLFTVWLLIWAGLLVLLSSIPIVTNTWVYDILPPLRLFDFLSGILLGLTYLQLTKDPENFFERIRIRYSTAFEVTAICLIVFGISMLPRAHQGIQYGVFLEPFWAVLIFTFAWQRGFLSRILSAKPLVFLGNVSFSFYMVHQLVLRSIASTRFGHHSIISLVTSIILASLIYITFEEPNRVRLKTYLEQLALPEKYTQKIHLRLPLPKPAPEVQPIPIVEAVTSED